MKLVVSARTLAFIAVLCAPMLYAPQAHAQQAAAAIPNAPREMRGVWIPTAWNLSWPSKKGLPVQRQQQEMIAILDKAKSLNLNTVIFQVRSSGEAMYDSKLAPWSENITGRQGQAPEPYYDPLTFAIDEAHKRGLQLHAWFNPYRAAISLNVNFADNHVSKIIPEATKKLDKYFWLDPGSKEAQDHVHAVVLDVVRRYDVDGIQFDDYFYPWPSEMTKTTKTFPDNETWQQYQSSGGTLARDDWRRDNVNTLMQRVYESIKQTKPRVLFGISPFGIWRAGNPPGIVGTDAHDVLFGDSRKWLQEGWLDYISPQLYWDLSRTQLSYPKLLAWWVEQNIKRRHMWPGISIHETGQKFKVDDPLKRLDMTRKQPGATGVVWYHMPALMQDQANFATQLKQTAYAAPALIPPSPWLDNAAPAAPAATVTRDVATGGMALQWAAPTEQDAFLVAIYARVSGVWQFDVVPAAAQGYKFPAAGAVPDTVAVSVVDRMGNESVKQNVELRGEASGSSSISIPSPVTAPALPGSR